MTRLHSTNYQRTLITVAPDTHATKGMVVTSERPTIASLMYAKLCQRPYEFTSDDVIYAVYAERNGAGALPREAFFAKPQACFRASDLCKRLGWGVHANEHGKISIVGMDSSQYLALMADSTVRKVAAMRSKK
jgi:hypothetical protein